MMTALAPQKMVLLAERGVDKVRGIINSILERKIRIKEKLQTLL